MSSPSLSSETLHVSAVAIGGRAVLIGGRSGTGKSDLALRLIDRGAVLISDDYTHVHRVKARPWPRRPPISPARARLRGVGIVEREAVAEVPVACRRPRGPPERLPRGEDRIAIAGISVPIVALDGHYASAPLKVEAALLLFVCPPDERRARYPVLRLLARRATRREPGARHALLEESALAGRTPSPVRAGRAGWRLYCGRCGL